MTNCRIGKVTYKNLKVVQLNAEETLSATSRDLIDSAIDIANNAPVPIDGFAIIAWGKEHHINSLRWSSGSIPYDYLPEYVRSKLFKRIHELENGWIS